MPIIRQTRYLSTNQSTFWICSVIVRSLKICTIDHFGRYLFPLTTDTLAMTIELSKEVRQQAISSIERYFLENLDDKIGNIAAGALLGFFLDEIGPVIYNTPRGLLQTNLS